MLKGDLNIVLTDGTGMFFISAKDALDQMHTQECI